MEESRENTPHKRRVHYSGKYPKRFEEKYKELQPEKYGDMAEHIKQKGGTPAGSHVSIMVEEILDFLQIQPGQQGLDATLGYGGHSSHMLKALQGSGHLHGLDVDPIEIVKTRKRLEDMDYGPEIFTAHSLNFADVDTLVEETGPFDFVLADLGVSSMQIDNPERGFTYKFDGPLDLRLNPQAGVSAADRLMEVTAEELASMLEENSDEPYALEIARAIKQKQKKGHPVRTTLELKAVIEDVVRKVTAPAQKSIRGKKPLRAEVPAVSAEKPLTKDQKELVKKTCARTFQALRIDVNSEFEVLDAFMQKLPHILKPGGRAAILTFHSGEDRLVKKAMKWDMNQGLYSEICSDVIRPSQEECVRNPRAKSTKMRWAIRSEE